jgi:hypothetical protein
LLDPIRSELLLQYADFLQQNRPKEEEKIEECFRRAMRANPTDQTIDSRYKQWQNRNKEQ